MDGGKMSRSREIPTRDGKVAVRITGSLPQLVAIGPRLPVTYTKSSENKESPVKPSVYDTVSSIPVPPQLLPGNGHRREGFLSQSC